MYAWQCCCSSCKLICILVARVRRSKHNTIIKIHYLAGVGCRSGGLGGMGRKGLNDEFPFNVLYHCVCHLNWIHWIVPDSYIWQTNLKCKRMITAKWGKTALWYKNTALPLNVLYLCMHFEFPSALLELCQGQENLRSKLIQRVSKADQSFLYTALSLNIVYLFMKFQQNPLNRFGLCPLQRVLHKRK